MLLIANSLHNISPHLLNDSLIYIYKIRNCNKNKLYKKRIKKVFNAFGDLKPKILNYDLALPIL